MSYLPPIWDQKAPNWDQKARKSHDEAPGTFQYLYDGLPRNVQNVFSQPNGHAMWKNARKPDLTEDFSFENLWRAIRNLRRPSWTEIGLIVVWIALLWWGEEVVFSKSISRCDWTTWEQWPAQVTPHHVVLLADPQLIDPHTYPGRPWPLSTMTIRHTDQYLRRAFTALQRKLDPDSAFFLGDLFDGGREWGTARSTSPDKQWKRYNGKFWLKEYNRFGRIFFNNWNIGASPNRNRKFIASLPGNHDLGIGNGIQIPVRERFTTFFGDGNRIDIIGNHTFVSVDTVSLTAKGQNELSADGSQGGQWSNKDIWGPTEKFLAEVKDRKLKVLDRELRARAGRSEHRLYEQVVLELNDSAIRREGVSITPNVSSNMPTILLTHVPLYRSPGTPCGPLREKYPPSRPADGADALESDDANAISVSAGLQYQNVLFPDISKQLIDQIGNVVHVFSGDDHDYCEVVHRGFTSRGGGIREITVKAMSWAMGVRKPGFLMLSLWNPIDDRGDSKLSEESIDGAKKGITLQSHLCLLPDQLGIFIRYGLLFGFTGVALLIRALGVAFGSASVSKKTGRQHSESKEQFLNGQKRSRADTDSGSSSSNSSETHRQKNLAIRPSAGRTRSVSPAGGYAIPLASTYTPPVPKSKLGLCSNWDDRYEEEESISLIEGVKQKSRRVISVFWHEFKSSFMQVAGVALIWYTWLACTH